MSKRFLMGLFCGAMTSVGFAKENTEARFRVLPMVVAENPGAYTFTVAEGPVNALLKCGNFEPISLRTKWHALADSPNDIRIDPIIMSYYDSKHTGFYDGAKVRIYRVRNGKLVKVREDRVKEYVVEDWNYGVEGLYAGQLVDPSSTQASTHIAEWSRKGCDAWFAVVAVNKDGNRSPVSNAVRIHIPENYPVKPLKGQNRIAARRIPWKPIGDTTPAAPANFRAQLNPATGEIRMKWDPVSDPNLIGYQIAKTDYNPATLRGNHIYLENSPADPAKHIKVDDMIFVDHEILEFNRDKMMSNRVLDAIPEQIKQPYFKDTPTRRWKLEPHSADAPAELKHSGRTCVRIEVEDSDELTLRKHNHAGLKQNWYPVLDPEKTYLVEFWAKHDGLTNPAATFRLEGLLEESFQPLEYSLSNDWKKYKGEFRVAEKLQGDEAAGVGLMVLAFNGPGTVWVDNWRVYEKGTAFMDYPAEDYEALRESGMSAFRSHAHIKTEHGYSMDGFTNPAGGIEWRGKKANGFNTLPNQLAIMKKAGLDPWLQIEMCMDESEWQGFVEYMCAPYDPATDSAEEKPWAYKRHQQGQEKPYLDEFERIIFEVGNETWNPIFKPWIFNGVSLVDEATGRNYINGEVYGLFQEYVIDLFRSSPHWSVKAEQKFEFVLGGWASQTDTNGYGQAAARFSPNSEHVLIAAYNGGWDEGAPPAKPGPKGYSDALGIADRTTIPRALKLNGSLEAASVKSALGTYEAGPGYNINGLNGVDMTMEQVEQEAQTMKSLAAGTATLDAFLAQGLLGFKLQNFFTFERNRNYWTSHARMENGGQAYPSWKLLSLYNNEGTGDFLMVQSLTDPLVSAYATKEGNRCNLFVLSRRVDGYPDADSDGFSPVQIQLPFRSTKSITLYRTTGMPADHNLDSDQVKIERIELDANTFSPNFSVNEASGGDTRGLPPASTFLYVFEDVEWLKWRGDAAFVNLAPGQVSKTREDPIRFRVALPSGDLQELQVAGTSGANRTASVEPVPGSYGTVYDVAVDNMSGNGSVALKCGRQSAVVEYTVPEGKQLPVASWNFQPLEKTDVWFPKHETLAATRFMGAIEQPVLTFGEIFPPSDNPYYNNDGLAVMPKEFWKETTEADEKGYIGWTIQPRKNMALALDQVKVGLWNFGAENPLEYELRYRIGGSGRFREIDFQPLEEIKGHTFHSGQGVPAIADLKSIEELQKLKEPVEFRIYLWGKDPRGIGKLEGSDLVVSGRLAN